MEQENLDLVRLSKHSPRILRHQIILDLLGEYFENSCLRQSKDVSSNDQVALEPTLQRFHGALLFVDISGFTALSLKLDVDELKDHINEYFSSMLAIVDEYDGEVIKFAGDALYILWQTDITKIAPSSYPESYILDSVHSLETEELSTGRREALYHAASKLAIQKAVRCGIEIGSKCSNHPVVHYPSKLRKMFGMDQAGAENSVTNRPSYHENKQGAEPVILTHLNVHSGVGVGLMAGLDVGLADRREFLLIGKPITEVALAEGEATLGECVLGPAAHALFHGPSDDGCCGCVKTPKGCFCVSSSTRIKSAMLIPSEIGGKSSGMTPASNYGFPVDLRASRIVSSMVISSEATQGESSSISATSSHGHNYFHRVTNETRRSVCAVLELVGGLETKLFEDKKELVYKRVMDNSALRHSSLETMIAEGHISDCQLERRAMLQSWLYSCLLNDLESHVHAVVRKYHEGTAPMTRRETALTHMEMAMRKEVGHHLGIMTASSPQMGYPLTDTGSSTPRSVGSISSERSVARNIKSPTMRNLQKSMLKSLNNSNQISANRSPNLLEAVSKPRISHTDAKIESESAMSAEQRDIVVLFISLRIDKDIFTIFVENEKVQQIQQPIVQHPIESELPCKLRHKFSFLGRSTREKEADTRLLSIVQQCMVIIHRTLDEKGGHLRQFIVDDKGTVAIGTFGLKGSTGGDIAAAAIDASNAIIVGLKRINVNASIGVTSGTAYCGLVGSSDRHEFAVMGPTVNLSARLMGKASLNSILCDAETRGKDTMHPFVVLGNIVAKGYSEPVPTFRPVVRTANMTHGALSAFLHNMKSGQNGTIKRLLNATIRVNNVESENTVMPTMFSANTSEGTTGDLLLQFIQALSHTVFKLEKVDAGSLDGSDKNRSIYKTTQRWMGGQTISGAGRNASDRTLFGREEEINLILSFLLRPHIKTTTQDSASSLLASTMPSNVCVISGPGGIGKFSLRTAICRKLDRVVTRFSQFNISVFCDPSPVESKRHYNGKKPMQSWEHVLICVFLATVKEAKKQRALNKLLNVKNASTGTSKFVERSELPSAKRSIKIISSTDSSTIDDPELSYVHKMMEGLQYLIGRLTPELQVLQPLLCLIMPYFEGEKNMESNVTVDALTTAEAKMNALQCLIAAIFQQFVFMTNSLAFIDFGEIDETDEYSNKLLLLLAKTCTGFCFLCSSSDAENSSLNTHSGDSNDLSSGKSVSQSFSGSTKKAAKQITRTLLTDLLKLLGDDRFMNVEIGCLDEQSSLNMIQEVLFGISTNIEDDIVLPSPDKCKYKHEISPLVSGVRQSSNQYKTAEELKNAAIKNVFDLTAGHPFYIVSCSLQQSLQPRSAGVATLKKNKGGGAVLFSYTQQKSVSKKTSETAEIGKKKQMQDTIVNLYNIVDLKADDIVMHKTSDKLKGIICSRYDLLSPVSQLLLKIIAIAASYSGRCSYSLLYYMMGDEDDEDESAHAASLSADKFADMLTDGMLSNSAAFLEGDAISEDAPQQRRAPKRRLNIHEILRTQSSENSQSLKEEKQNDSGYLAPYIYELVHTMHFLRAFRRKPKKRSSQQRKEYSKARSEQQPGEEDEFECSDFRTEEWLYKGKFDEENDDIEFSFRSLLEQSTIKMLMLSEQMNMIHAGVALFLQQRHASLISLHSELKDFSFGGKRLVVDAVAQTIPIAKNVFLREAYHWEACMEYEAALECYIKVALVQTGDDGLPGCYEALQSSVSMLDKLGSVHANKQSNNHYQPHRLSITDLSLCLKRLTALIAQCDPVTESAVQSPIRASEEFVLDAPYIPTHKVMCLCAIVARRLWIRREIVLPFFEHALYNLLECHHPMSEISNELVKNPRAVVLRAFAIIGNIITALGDVPDQTKFNVKELSMLQGFYRRWVPGLHSLPLTIKLDELQLRDLLNDCSRKDTTQMRACAESIVYEYEQSNHSSMMISVFGADLTPGILARASHELVLLGDLDVGSKHIDFLSDVSTELAAANAGLESLASLVYPLCFALMRLRKYERAASLFEEFWTKCLDSKVSYYITYSSIFMDSLSILVRCQYQFSIISEILSESADKDCAPVVSNVEMLSKRLEQFLLEEANQRAVTTSISYYSSMGVNEGIIEKLSYKECVNDDLAIFGRSLDLQLAHLSFIKAYTTFHSDRSMSSIAQAEPWLKLCKRYTAESVYLMNGSNTKYYLNRANTLLLQLQVHELEQSMFQFTVSSSAAPELKTANHHLLREESEDLIRLCYDFAAERNYALLFLHTTQFEGGAPWTSLAREDESNFQQVKAIHQIRAKISSRQSITAKSATSIFRRVFNTLCSIIPGLSRYERLLFRYRKQSTTSTRHAELTQKLISDDRPDLLERFDI